MFNSKSNKSMFNLFSFLLLFITLNNISHKITKYIGLISILLLLGLSSLIFIFILTKNIRLNNNKKHFLITYIVLILILFVGVLINATSKAIITQLQLILIINFFLIYSLVNYEKEQINSKILFLVLTVYIGTFYIGFFSSNSLNGNYSSIYENSNGLGVTALLLSGISMTIFLINNNRLYMFYAFLFTIIMGLSGTRSSIIVLFIIILIYMLFKSISKNKFIWNISLYIILFMILLSTYIYPLIDQFTSFSKWNLFIYNITGKNLLSGRNYIWKYSFELIKKRPLWGYGTGIQISNISDISVSTHNFYIQLLIQNGVIGLVVFIILVISIWKMLYNGKDDQLVRFCSSFFIGTLVQNMFEVTFLQNNIAIAIMQWFIIAVGVSRAINIRNLNN